MTTSKIQTQDKKEIEQKVQPIILTLPATTQGDPVLRYISQSGRMPMQSLFEMAMSKINAIIPKAELKEL